MENVTFEEFIIGTLLGDGCIAKLSKGGKNYRWSCGHSEKQLEYLKWKVDFLVSKNLHTGKILKYTSYNSRYKKPCISYYTKSRTNSVFNKYREMFYPNNKKILPKNIIITSNILTILYMDDGHLLHVKNKTPKALFNLHSFSNEERELLCKKLEPLGLKATCRHSNGEIAISAKSMNRFREIVKPFSIFNYKMGPV